MSDRLVHPVFPRNLLVNAGIQFTPSANHVLVAKLPKSRLEKDGRFVVPTGAARIDSMATTWGQVMAVGPRVEQLKPGMLCHWAEMIAGMDGFLVTHYDIDKFGGFRALPNIRPQDRRFVVLREDEIDISVSLEPGETLPVLHDA